MQAENIPLEFLPGEGVPNNALHCPSLGRDAGAISSDLRQYLYLPIYRTHVSLSSALPEAFASGDPVGSQSSCSPWFADGFLLRLAHFYVGY